MLHIVLLSTSYPYSTPGSEAAGSFVEDFAIELAKHCRVSVIAPAMEASSSRSENLDVIRFSVPRLPLSTLNPFKPRDIHAIFSTLQAGRQSLFSAIRTHKVDHILALWALPSGYWARQTWKTHGVPYSTWALGSDVWSLGKIPGIRRILQQVLRDAQSRFADGLELCSVVEQMASTTCCFMPSTRSFPLNPDHQPAAQPPYRLAFLGRWHRNKGTDLLLESLSMLSGQDWSRISEIRIHGGGPLEDIIRQQVDELRKSGKPVTVGGYLDKTAAAKLISRADYLLIPSRIESIPVIFSDAMKSNTPVVATPAGDLPALVSRYRCGITATAVTPHSLRNAIARALDSSAESFVPGTEKARGDFDLRNIVMQFLDAIRR